MLRTTAGPLRCALLVALGAICPIDAGAAQDAGRGSAGDPVVITASRLAQPLTDAIAHTTVLNQDDIARSGSTDLAGLLTGIAGVDLSRNGGPGALATPMLRGAEARQVLILIDGMRFESASAGTARIEHLMLDQIERVEIVRGNVSALYGSAAVGGVIQVFTKRGAGKPHANASIEIGSYGEQRIAIGSSGQLDAAGDTRYALQGSHYRIDGPSAIDPSAVPGVNPDHDGYRNASFSGSISHRISASNRLGARIYYTDALSAFDNPFGAGPGEINELDSRLSQASAWWHSQLGARWLSKLRAGISDERSHNRTDALPPARFDTTRSEIDWQNDFELEPGQVLSLGLTSMHQRLESNTAFEHDRRVTNSAYAAWNARFGQHQLEAALRHDAHSDVGGANSWQLGYGLALSPRWKLLARASSAFTAPSFNYLYFPGFSNPDLKPERARSIETGLQYASGGLMLRANLFRTRYSDLIDSPPPSFVPRNVARARVDGLELSASGQLAGWLLRASASFQRPVNLETGDTLLRRARRFGALEASRRLGRWEGGATLTWAGRRSDFRIDTFMPTELDGYSRLDLHLRRTIVRGLELVLRLNNATDERYASAHGYPAPARTIHVGLQWQPE